MKDEKHFPNGFESWMQTHHEVVTHLVKTADVPSSVAHETRAALGRAELYDLGSDLTDEFEKLHEGWVWGTEPHIDWYDEVEKFLIAKEKAK